MKFTIAGKIKPYVRMTQRGKWVKDEAQEYLSSKSSIGLQLRRQMAECELEMLPAQTPLYVKLFIEQPNNLHRSDLDNLIKAVLDAAQGIIFHNDCWIDWIEASRHIGNDYLARLIVLKNDRQNAG